MVLPTYDILGIGNAIVDVVARAEDTFLSRHDMHKGAMILIFGPPGVGKSHVGCGIGHALIDAGYRVLTMRTSELVQRLQAAG